MLKIAEQTDDVGFIAKVPIAAPPAIIILNELSTYFADDPSATLSSYLGLVTLALETVASFGTSVSTYRAPGAMLTNRSE